MDLFRHSGILHYTRSDNEYWLVADVDPQLGAYYRALMPKYYDLSRGRYDTHCTIIRGGKDIPRHPEHWGKYDGRRVEFFYEPGVRCGDPYYWLRVVSKEFEDIRLELGLPVEVSFDPSHASYAAPPEPFRKYFHITIGNTKI